MKNVSIMQLPTEIVAKNDRFQRKEYIWKALILFPIIQVEKSLKKGYLEHHCLLV
jgi:hypothetical protein